MRFKKKLGDKIQLQEEEKKKGEKHLCFVSTVPQNSLRVETVTKRQYNKPRVKVRLPKGQYKRSSPSLR
jgi:hypothetical protein